METDIPIGRDRKTQSLTEGVERACCHEKNRCARRKEKENIGGRMEGGRLVPTRGGK